MFTFPAGITKFCGNGLRRLLKNVNVFSAL